MHYFKIEEIANGVAVALVSAMILGLVTFAWKMLSEQLHRRVSSRLRVDSKTESTDSRPQR